MTNVRFLKDNQTHTQNVDKANVLNEHFSSVFTKPDTLSDYNPSLEGNPILVLVPS